MLLKFPSTDFVVQLLSCVRLCDPMDCSTPGIPVLHHLPELAQTHVHWVSNTIHLIICRPCLQSFPAPGSFPMSQLFASGGQNIGASDSASVLLMNIQDCFPLGLTDLISLWYRDSQESSPTPQLKKHHFFSTQLSLWPNSHIHIWLLQKP